MFYGCAVSWKSNRQSIVALSSAEAVRKLLEKLGVPQQDPNVIGKDNRTCIAS
jgi:hypothetical protein